MKVQFTKNSKKKKLPDCSDVAANNIQIEDKNLQFAQEQKRFTPEGEIESATVDIPLDSASMMHGSIKHANRIVEPFERHE